jgi:UDP-glucose 4-epimerase
MVKKEKVLILGGAGFIGSHLAEILADSYEVTVFDRARISLRNLDSCRDRIHVIAGDFTNAAEIADVVAGMDIVFHLIWSTLPATSNQNPAYDLETNVIPFLHLLSSLRNHQVKRLVFISSGGTVYGDPQRLPICEEAATRPRCSYGITKLTAEKYLEMHCQLHGQDAIVARLANVYGERQEWRKGQGLVMVALQRALSGEPLEIWGDGNAVRDYIHVSDVVIALKKLIPYRGDHRLFNIGSGRGHSVMEIVNAVHAVSGRRPQVRFLPGRALDVSASVLDNSRACSELDWLPRLDLENGMRQVFNWLCRQYFNG